MEKARKNGGNMLLCGIHFREALNFLKLQRFWVRAWLTIADLLESLEFSKHEGEIHSLSCIVWGGLQQNLLNREKHYAQIALG